MAEALPLLQGTSSTGANSIAISPDGNRIIVVGGDFTNDTIASQNIVGYQLSKTKKPVLKNIANQQIVWKNIHVSNPKGYKSSVEFIDNDLLITCGTSGVDVSKDKGANWNTISKDPYHIVKKHPTKRGAYLAGSGGRISFVEL
jgi:sugar lactone lactonase YvrE